MALTSCILILRKPELGPAQPVQVEVDADDVVDAHEVQRLQHRPDRDRFAFLVPGILPHIA